MGEMGIKRIEGIGPHIPIKVDRNNKGQPVYEEMNSGQRFHVLRDADAHHQQQIIQLCAGIISVADIVPLPASQEGKKLYTTSRATKELRKGDVLSQSQLESLSSNIIAYTLLFNDLDHFVVWRRNWRGQIVVRHAVNIGLDTRDKEHEAPPQLFDFHLGYVNTSLDIGMIKGKKEWKEMLTRHLFAKQYIFSRGAPCLITKDTLRLAQEKLSQLITLNQSEEGRNIWYGIYGNFDDHAKYIDRLTEIHTFLGEFGESL